MNPSFRQFLREATRLTRAGHLRDATAALQRALGSSGARPSGAPPGRRATPPWPMPPEAAPGAAQHADSEVIDIEARVIEPARPAPPRTVPPRPSPSVEPGGPAREQFDPRPQRPAEADRNPAPSPGRFLAGTFTCAAGTRPYKLFVPGGVAVQPRPLLVLLHGCKQNPDDFAAGTRMNQLAQAAGWVVLYPAQPPSANSSGCWNWFQPADQQRDHGEPAILAGMTRHIVSTEGIDPQRVYVAGLSAGGAMAAVLATTHPDLFAAVGIHSGLPHGAAHDLMTALSVMRQGPSYGAAVAALPAIVFHGDHDKTVHPLNGEALVALSGPAGRAPAGGATPPRVETGRVPGGRRYTRSLYADPQGRVQAEHWLLHGAGHAWSGGSRAGSYTDPTGPDASAEMLRFFAGYRVAGGSADTSPTPPASS